MTNQLPEIKSSKPENKFFIGDVLTILSGFELTFNGYKNAQKLTENTLTVSLHVGKV